MRPQPDDARHATGPPQQAQPHPAERTVRRQSSHRRERRARPPGPIRTPSRRQAVERPTGTMPDPEGEPPPADGRPCLGTRPAPVGHAQTATAPRTVSATTGRLAVAADPRHDQATAGRQQDSLVAEAGRGRSARPPTGPGGQRAHEQVGRDHGRAARRSRCSWPTAHDLERAVVGRAAPRATRRPASTTTARNKPRADGPATRRRQAAITADGTRSTTNGCWPTSRTRRRRPGRRRRWASAGRSADGSHAPSNRALRSVNQSSRT